MRKHDAAMRNPKTKLILVLVVLCCAVALWRIYGKLGQIDPKYQLLSDEVTVAQVENDRLRERLEESQTLSGQELARRELGWVSNGEILFEDVD